MMMNQTNQPDLASADNNLGAIDPVCGMTVTKLSAAASFAYEGNTYYFCCTQCQEKFRKDPTAAPQPMAQLVGISRRVKSNANEYTCPMHPEVVRERPGSC